VCEKLNLKDMMIASASLIGEHDFKSFCSNKDDEKETFVRTVSEIDFESIGDNLIILVTGTGFLRHQVRKMVGTLVAVGKGEIEISEVKNILEQKNQRACVYKADGAGLYLKNVYYKEEEKCL
jgi:tRNA pseudouridine38-40 synthase